MLELCTDRRYKEMPLNDAADICLTETINDGNNLSFKIPINTFPKPSVGNVIICGGIHYIVEKISQSEETKVCDVQCTHEFVYLAKRLHVPRVAVNSEGDFIGTDLQAVLENAYKNAYTSKFGYGIMRDSDYTNHNVEKLSQLIDYESETRTTLWNVLQNIIAQAGNGEIFYNSGSHRFGIVKRLGADTGIILSQIHNMNNVSVEYDISETVTVLYPYGKDSMDITAAENNKSGTAYIISPKADEYGYIQGSKEYDISDLTGPDELLKRALWEFDESNLDRIDVPSVNISGTVTDLEIPEGICLGDTVGFIMDGSLIRERIIQIKRYFDGRPSEVAIGRVKKDMYYYLNQVGVFANRYKNISVSNGKISGNKISGTVHTTAKAVNADKAATLANTAGQITVDSDGVKILSAGKTFFAASKDNISVGTALTVAADGSAANVDELTFAGKKFGTDEYGNLYFNEKKIQFAEEG